LEQIEPAAESVKLNIEKLKVATKK
jgi:hypothetical protein